MSEKLSMKIEARSDELERVYAAVEEMGMREEWSFELAFNINLALEELGVNIVNYGQVDRDEPGEIEFTLVSDSESVTIDILDDGMPFDPLTETPAPTLEGAPAERPIGGLGVYLVQTIMEDMKYRRVDGKNHLTVVARRDS